MTDLAAASRSAPVTSNWADRLSWPVRIALLVVTTLGLVFCVGVAIGLTIAVIERGTIKPLALGAMVAALVLALAFGWLGWKLSAHWRRADRSAYERRYTKMITLLVFAGMPIGVLLGAASNAKPHEALFSNAPLDPLLAGIAAVTLVIALGGGLVAYHRSIDDHEQQAYLWANSLAFYFLALALPFAWLLARGGLIAPIGIGTAMLLLLAAFCINFTVWAWLKFR